MTSRLIFRLYVQEGYGTQRLSRYLAEHGITRYNGKNFPNTSLNHIIKDKLYVGIIHNGGVESDVIPELQIIDRHTFDEAQRLMSARAQKHSDTPLNMSGRSLLIGNVYCGHCRNRLTMSTSGHKHTRKDGTVIRNTRFLYQCHYSVRHPGECDGQTVYNAELEAAQKDLIECEDNADEEMREYKQIQTWADLYKTCTFEAKKMIVSRFIKSIYVHRGYNLEIEFNVPFEEFKRLAVSSDSPQNSIKMEVEISA